MVAPRARLVILCGFLWPVVRAIGAPRRRVSGGRGAGFGGISQAARSATPLVCGRACRGHGELDAADGDADQRPDLQEREPDGAAREAGTAAARRSAHRPSRRTTGALVGAQGGGRGAIGIKIELAFLDAVLHVAAGAVDVLVELSRSRLSALERGDEEARIGLALRPLRLGDDAAPAPATSVLYWKSLKRRAGCPLFSAIARAAASSCSIMATRRALRASPNT